MIVFDFFLSDTNVTSTNASGQNAGFNKNLNQDYSKDPLINKFFELYNLYTQFTALHGAYSKDKEAAILRQSIEVSKNSNKSDVEKFANSKSVTTEYDKKLKNEIYCRTEPLSVASKKNMKRRYHTLLKL
jgi:hypothetical protein